MNFATERTYDFAFFVYRGDVSEMHQGFDFAVIKPLFVFAKIRSIDLHPLAATDCGVEISLPGIWAMAFMNFGSAIVAGKIVFLRLIGKLV